MGLLLYAQPQFFTKFGVHMEYQKPNSILITIDNAVIDRYADYYFSIHTKAHKKPISHPYHESINTWMVMKRPAMNALKQRWKDFIHWLVEDIGYEDLQIERCEIVQTIYYPTNRRHDIDNTVPKFVLDGLVDSGMIVDDDCTHIRKLTMMCFIDSDNPRTEFEITIV